MITPSLNGALFPPALNSLQRFSCTLPPAFFCAYLPGPLNAHVYPSAVQHPLLCPLMLSLLLCCPSHAACLQHGRSILAEGNCCPTLLAPGRSHATSVLGLCIIAYEGEYQQAEGRKIPLNFYLGYGADSLWGQKKAATLRFYSRPGVHWQE